MAEASSTKLAPPNTEGESVERHTSHDLPSDNGRADGASPTPDAQPGAEDPEFEKSLEAALSRTSTKRSRVQQITHPETDLDKGIVGWDGQDDPEHPLNFPRPRKWGLLALVSAITFVSPLASSMFAPAVSFMGKEFGIASEFLLSFSVSVYLLGYTLGPTFIAPLSEIYGRRLVLSVANWFFVLWQVGCALAPNIATLIVFRFFAGIGGSGCLTLGAGVIADLFVVEERGLATSIWSLGPLIGPVIGPIAGGFIGQQIGWRWVYWILLIAGGVTSLGIEFLNRETYDRVLIRWKTTRLSKELNRTDLRSCYEKEGDHPTVVQTLKIGLARPLQMLFRSPLVFLLSLYMAIIYGLLYLMFTTITFVFQNQYGWSPEITGLSYLGLGVGFFLGMATVGATSDKIVIKLTKRNHGKFEPEMRLPSMVFFACFIPISLFWYGWTADKRVFWIVPIIGMVPFSFGLMGVFLLIQTYLIDCYTVYAASAVATLVTTRSLVGALLPLAGAPLYSALGLGWGNSLLAFVALVCIPIPVLFTKYGKLIREKYPLKFEKKVDGEV